MENHNKLAYADEKDKTYGITGMAITLVALDGEDYLAAIDLDADAGEHLRMSPDFGFKGNPRMSAKIVWEQTLRDLRLTTSMAIGNVACRRYVMAHRGISSADTAELRNAMRQDATDHCGLDTDEADRLFESCMGYVDSIFRHAGIAGVANGFAERLTRQRAFSGAEAIEILASLGLR